MFGSHWRGGGGVVGLPCQAGGGGGGGAAGGGGGGGAFSYFVPETQHVCATGAGTALFSKQRAFGPCTPGFTYVNATQGASFMHAAWHSPGLAAGKSKLR